MGGYKEYKIFDLLKRKGVIIRYVVAIVLVFILMLVAFMSAPKKAEDKNVYFTENSKVGYKVFLKENEFFEQQYLKEGNQYIASLIDYIEVNFKYDLGSLDAKSNYKYSYKIVAETNVTDKTNHNPLYDLEEALLEQTELANMVNTKVSIDETIKIDYNKFNDLINKFIYVYDLEGSDSLLDVNMYVTVLDSAGKEINTISKPVASLSIPLTEKTMAVDLETVAVDGNDITVAENSGNKTYLFAGLLLLALDIFLVIKLAIFIKDTESEKAVYNMRLRKIMSNYGSYIQKLYNEFEFDTYQILEIKSFEDLLQIRETINKPILMTEKSLAMETYFFIPCDKNVYIFELKAGNLKATRGKRYRAKAKQVEEEDTVTN